MTRGQLAVYAEMVIWVTSAGARENLYREYIDARTGAIDGPDRMRLPAPVMETVYQRTGDAS